MWQTVWERKFDLSTSRRKYSRKVREENRDRSGASLGAGIWGTAEKTRSNVDLCPGGEDRPGTARGVATATKPGGKDVSTYRAWGRSWALVGGQRGGQRGKGGKVALYNSSLLTGNLRAWKNSRENGYGIKKTCKCSTIPEGTGS